MIWELGQLVHGSMLHAASSHGHVPEAPRHLQSWHVEAHLNPTAVFPAGNVVSNFLVLSLETCTEAHCRNLLSFS
jgi:hypothetical protein